MLAVRTFHGSDLFAEDSLDAGFVFGGGVLGDGGAFVKGGFVLDDDVDFGVLAAAEFAEAVEGVELAAEVGFGVLGEDGLIAVAGIPEAVVGAGCGGEKIGLEGEAGEAVGVVVFGAGDLDESRAKADEGDGAVLVDGFDVGAADFGRKRVACL